MLKSIGSLHNIPAPSAAVLGESLKLLATFGDKKGITALLEQMREVQTQNEQVFRDAQAAIGELTVMRKELEDSRSAFATARDKEAAALGYRTQELSKAEARLSGKEAAFAKKEESAISALVEKEMNMRSAERTVAAREQKCQEKERDLDLRSAAMEKLESDLHSQEQRLRSKQQKLRDVLDGG